MTAPDIGDRIRWTLDLYTKSLDENGDPQPDGWIVQADGAGNNEYVDPSTITTGSGSQRILLADGRSTPFTFDDLLQADDGSDFLWSDPE